MSTSVPFERAASRASLVLAVLVLTSLLASVGLRASWPLAAVGPCGLSLLMYMLRDFATERSHWPNAITLARVLVTSWLGQTGVLADGALVAAVVFGLFALDGLDGLVARRLDAASRQGAHLDMESDGFLVMTVGLTLFLRGLPAWVLLGGVLRYAYVIAITAFEARGEVPRSRLGRYVFGLSLNGFALACLPIGTLAVLLAGASTLLLSWSFGRSFYWSFRDTSVRTIETTS